MGIHNKYTRIKDMLMNVFETLFYKLQTSSAIFRSCLPLHFMVLMVGRHKMSMLMKRDQLGSGFLD